ncbi:LANO_0G14730g1_1 [Lachancea nothofagi CBS 11611]|uniref:LANO_0G14730g1_1 n=1 Tax=Lachancea nothofagi CBS 11611 TaxID=1266666 RepID=A0A1G4KK54_9SACH|nr:LANO_0G14730g1_1 [Lachancea nothofagi CBS 11611]
MVKIAIITYSMYGHIDILAKSIQEGIVAAGGKADLFRVEETLPDEVLELMHAPAKPDIPVATAQTLEEYDAFLFGVPTRYGNVPAQWSAFWDQTGGLWVKGSLHGKPAGVFVSTGSFGGGQELTVKSCMSYLVHHGLIFIPLGYKNTFAELSNLEEIHGGSPWGAGTLASGDGSRLPSELELRMAVTQGKAFYEIAQHFPLPSTKKSTTKQAQTEEKKVPAQRTVQSTATPEKRDAQKKNGCCVLM